MRAAVVIAIIALLSLAGCDGGADPDGPRLQLPPRPADAPDGSEVASDIRGLEPEAREERILAEVARGNVPGWLRPLEPVEVPGTEGRTSPDTFWVATDYLALGSEEDYLYVPLSPAAARRAAELAGASLPTPRLVDAIWSAAAGRLIPIRFRPNEDIGTVRYFLRHNRLVQAQRRQHRARPGDLTAGHKLDVVAVREATEPQAAGSPGEGGEAAIPAPDSGALYGWHHTDGTPIQPLYRVPADAPAHYSMGVRLVYPDPPAAQASAPD